MLTGRERALLSSTPPLGVEDGSKHAPEEMELGTLSDSQERKGTAWKPHFLLLWSHNNKQHSNLSAGNCGCCLQINRDLQPGRIPVTKFSLKTENTIVFTDLYANVMLVVEEKGHVYCKQRCWLC